MESVAINSLSFYRRICWETDWAFGVDLLVIVWHLLADPAARFHDLGSDFHATAVNKARRTRNLVHQLKVLGHKVTQTPAA